MFTKTARNVLHCGLSRVKLVSSYFQKHLLSTQAPHKNLANENTLFFKNRPIKKELPDNFSQQQIIDNFLTICVSCQLNQRFYSIYLKKTPYY
jgi:hypothetical protein